MKILALEHDVPGAEAQDWQALLQAEARRVWELLQAGGLREIYFRGDRRTAVLLLECSGVQEAQSLLDSLPLVRAGLICFEVIPLVPYSGLERLFAPQDTPRE